MDSRPSTVHGEVAPIDRLMSPMRDFLRIEAVSGIVLVVCTVIAVFIAHSPWAHDYEKFLHTEIGFNFGEHTFQLSLLHWINDGLMTIFFFVVGLEIKRELVIGELRDWRTALLPVAAAAGGMIAPALVYLLFQAGTPAAKGWGVPTATDIAFVVGILALLGNRVPLGLKIFLLSLAIVDDLGAVIIIAFFYSENLATGPLVLVGLGLILVGILQRLGVWSIPVYVVVGSGIWLGMLAAHVHPTIAGVALGFMTPIAGRLLSARPFEMAADEVAELSMGEETLEERDVQKKLFHLHRLTNLAVSPLERLEHFLHSWVAYLIIPVFALANAAVTFEPSALSGSIAWAVAAGLIVGKPVGIMAMTALAVVSGLGKLPKGVDWPILVGGSCLAGIGFTMSLFVASLAFDDPHDLATAKIGVFLGSVTSAILGVVILIRALPRGVEE